ncbi:FecR domain-containing protein [Algoriphagus sp. D3-2-R+10]|uniref:FecR family protein n=1 Tax=Algoriphagus aurantiacus TaxID=3103948 RepID=UPI002B36A539|nr:FecR domain-containing protein [Algoriphagus sp. D3-2-R+10]MEB2777412.1 FecR domain-containing protein [Algoriphagus sp. D3-2-R+10]
MTEVEFKNLLDKYLRDECNDSEKRLLDDFFDSFKGKGSYLEDQNVAIHIEKERVKHRLYRRIQEELENENQPAPNSAKNKNRIGWMVLAVVVPLMLFWFISSDYVGGSEKLLKLEAERGQKISLTLGDGTRVRLNSGSSLIYPEEFKGAERKVKLEGEAFFEVFRNEKKPFVIQTAEIKTTVLGTSFNINTHSKGIMITVVTGKVSVVEGLQEVVLTKGMQAIYNPDDGSILTQSVDHYQEATAWMDERIVFRNVDLLESLNTLERWYGVEFDVKTKLRQGCKVNGNFKDQPLAHVLEALSFINGLEYRIISATKVEITSSKCST